MESILRSGSLGSRDFLFLTATCQFDSFSSPLFVIMLTEKLLGSLLPDYSPVRDVRNEFRIYIVQRQV